MKGDTTRGLDEDPPEPESPLFGKRMPAACARCGLGGDEHDLVNHRCPTDGLTDAERVGREIGEAAAARFGAKGGNCFNDVEVPPLAQAVAALTDEQKAGLVESLKGGYHRVTLTGPDLEIFALRCRSCEERARQPLRPLSDVLFVRPDPTREVTRWGIVLPDDPKVKQAVWSGVVLAAGPGFVEKDGRRRTMQVAVGDRVVFPRYSAQVLPGEEPAVWSLLEREVLATCGVDVVLTDAKVNRL